MADEIDAILGDGAAGDDIDALLGDEQGTASRVPGLAGRDAGPAARRAATLRPPGPRMLTDEQAGVASGPLETQGIERLPPFFAKTVPFGQRPNAVSLGPEEMRALEGTSTWDMDDPIRRAFMRTLPPAEREAVTRGEIGDFNRFLAAGAAGGIAGRAVGGVASKVLPRAAAPVLAPVAAGAGEGATIAKVMGGDPVAGAAMGAIVPAAVGTVNVAERALARGAPARVGARIERNLGENVKARTADKVTAVAKKGALQEVVARNPELREALAIQAKEKPTKALEAVQKTKARATEARDADFDRMQEHYADKPPSSQATVSGLLDEFDKLIEQSPGKVDRAKVLEQARAEVVKLGDKLRKRQGLPPAQGDYSGTVMSPHDLRDLEATIGKRAYEGFAEGDVLTVKRAVNAELYKPIARQVHGLAENTPGVDAKKFAHTGQDIHVLIPVEEALAYKAKQAAQGKTTLTEKLANVAHGTGTLVAGGAGLLAHGGTGAIVGLVAPTVMRGAGRFAARQGRKLDFRLAEEAQRFGLPPVEIPSGAARAGASLAYARQVSDAMKGGASLQEAVKAADEGH